MKTRKGILPGVALFSAWLSGMGMSALLVGGVSLFYAVANNTILVISLKEFSPRWPKRLRLISLFLNFALFLVWLVSCLDSGGLQQLEGPAILLLAIVVYLNWYVLGDSRIKSNNLKV